IFNKWLNEGRDVMHVIKYLKDANFDPEFYSKYENEIAAKFNLEFGTDIKPEKKNWKRIFAIG
ncbi:MAG: NAD(P)/FAD-dependent oxidoreductase, partial [Eudoraea sp.]